MLLTWLPRWGALILAAVGFLCGTGLAQSIDTVIPKWQAGDCWYVESRLLDWRGPKGEEAPDPPPSPPAGTCTYRFCVVGVAPVEGRTCYQVSVDRVLDRGMPVVSGHGHHMVLYFRTDDLLLVRTEKYLPHAPLEPVVFCHTELVQTVVSTSVLLPLEWPNFAALRTPARMKEANDKASIDVGALIHEASYSTDRSTGGTTCVIGLRTMTGDVVDVGVVQTWRAGEKWWREATLTRQGRPCAFCRTMTQKEFFHALMGRGQDGRESAP
jgi:hypothetical protein